MAELRRDAVRNRGIRITDYLFAADDTDDDADTSLRSDTLTQLIALAFQNPPASLTEAQQTALRTLLGVTVGGDGAPGGGALQLAGSFAVTIGAGNDDMFLAMGFNWPTTYKWLFYVVNGRGFWSDGEQLYHSTDGVTASTAGTASAAATRVQIQEGVTGAAYFGRTATNGALVEFSASAGAISIAVYSYVPGDDTTLQGERGFPGTDGADGTDGTDGTDGADGVGATGADGDDGATGDTGPPGADGADGAGAAPAQDEGTQVVATPTAWNFVGDGVVLTDVGGVATVTVPGGGGTVPTHTEQYLAGKATNAFVAADFTGTQGVAYTAGEHTATLPTVTGNVFGAVARLETDPEPVFADVNGSGLNQISDFTQQAGTVTINSAAYNVWVSNYAVFVTADEVEFR